MVIANPIFDVAFKFLMEDDRVAKFFIGTLLDETIEEVTVKPQEYLRRGEAKGFEGVGFSIYRLDFIATVKTASGERKKVLVEIQKAKNAIDLMRFRNYLGEHYKKRDLIDGQKVALPIVTIYLLGFKLTDVESCVIKVNRQYVDLLTHEVIAKKSEFIEKLSHDCYVVQLKRIGGKVKTKLDRLLSVFEQDYFIDENGIVKEYSHEIEDQDIMRILEKLHYFGTDPYQKKKIEEEQEYDRVFEDAIEEHRVRLEAKIADRDKVLEENAKALAEQQKALEDKDKALEGKDKALEDMAKMVEELKRKLGGV